MARKRRSADRILLRREIQHQLESKDATVLQVAFRKLEAFADDLGLDKATSVRLAALLDEEQPEWVRERTASCLAKIGVNRHTVGHVLASLRDKDSTIRDSACQALGMSRVRESGVRLRQLALRDPDEHVRFSGFEALALIGDVSLKGMIPHGLSDDSGLVRLATVRALRTVHQSGHLSQKKTRALMQRHLVSEQDPLVRVESWNLLHQLGDDHALSQLLELAGHTQGLVRWQSYEALSGVADCGNFRNILKTLRQLRRLEPSARARRHILALTGEVESRFGGNGPSASWSLS